VKTIDVDKIKRDNEKNGRVFVSFAG